VGSAELTRKEERMESERALEIANIIRQQIGGKAFMMLGAKDLIGLSEGGLQFQ
jgi:hypothetical protein